MSNAKKLKKEDVHNSKLFYATLKEICGKKSTSRGHCIKDKNGRILMSQKRSKKDGQNMSVNFTQNQKEVIKTMNRCKAQAFSDLRLKQH